jgi:NAD(P)-dependent dehydrogenase (short-subunit alcohol dehydrogenase family)
VTTPVPSTGLTWSLDEMPDQTGRTALVTGVSLGGLGHHTALELARRGARVVLAGRSAEKLEATARAIDGQVPGADLQRMQVDLADLTAIRSAVAVTDTGPLHLLVNNAGVMAVPFDRTPDGLERQMATNHFGPFLLTGLLMERLVASDDGRVVTVSSLMHRRARSVSLDDPRSPHGRYRRWDRYAETKLANLLFTFELERRLRRHELPVRAMAAHPGFAGTHLLVNGQLGSPSGLVASVLDAAVRAVSQSAAAGALPTLMAATADLPGGTYCGPSGMRESKGLPHVVSAARRAYDEEAQRGLWQLSEETVGLRWP